MNSIIISLLHETFWTHILPPHTMFDFKKHIHYPPAKITTLTFKICKIFWYYKKLLDKKLLY